MMEAVRAAGDCAHDGSPGDHHRLDGHRQQPGHQAAALVLVKGSAHSDNINARTEGVNMKLLTF